MLRARKGILDLGRQAGSRMCSGSHLRALILPADGAGVIRPPSHEAPPRCNPLSASCLFLYLATSQMRLFSTKWLHKFGAEEACMQALADTCLIGKVPPWCLRAEEGEQSLWSLRHCVDKDTGCPLQLSGACRPQLIGFLSKTTILGHGFCILRAILQKVLVGSKPRVL